MCCYSLQMFESPQCLPIPVLVLQGTDSSRGIHHSTHPEHGSPPRCSKRHRGQWVVSGELTRFSQASQYRPASPTDRLLKRMETGRGGCCNPSPASVSDQVHQTSYPYEEAFKQDTGGWRWPPSHRRPRRRMQDVPDGDCNPLRAVLSRSDGNHRQHSRQDQLLALCRNP